jgi:carbamoyl-phosphate synthase large subunit
MQKALRGLEVGVSGFDPIVDVTQPGAKTKIMHELQEAGADRIWYVADAFRLGLTIEDVFRATKIDRWFLVQIEDIIKEEANVSEGGLKILTPEYLRKLKRKGFADSRLATLIGVSEVEVRKKRHAAEINPVYKRVDTCAAEFSSDTAYMYSTYDEECEASPTDNDKIMILGGGPNRIGQGIEFDYCCVHAALALREDGYETIMVNCNPETVSTDYDTSDRLYFESITFEDVLEIVRIEKPKGVIVQYGGQTPLKLARALEAAGVPIIGTSPDAIDRAEDR